MKWPSVMQQVKTIIMGIALPWVTGMQVIAALQVCIKNAGMHNA